LFLSLGLTNVRRNMGRSVLAVTGAAVAAMIMTSIIALSSGYPAQGWAATRAFMGGDIMVYATPHLVPAGEWRQHNDATQQPGSGPAQPSWEYARLRPDQLSDLHYLHPELYGHGFLAPDGVAARPVSAESLSSALADNPHVRGVSASYFLPARVAYEVVDDSGETQLVELPQMVLRGREFEFASDDGAWSFDRLQTAGRMPGPEESGQPVGLIDGRLASLGYDRRLPLNQTVRLYVPAVVTGAGGEVWYDFSREIELSLDIIGHYEVLTEVAAWSDEMGNPQFEELFWVTPQIQVPSEFFAQVYHLVSGGQGLPPAMQFGVRVAPFSQVENIVSELRARLPGMTVISVPGQIELAHARGLPEAVFRAPLDLRGRPTVEQTGMPVDLSRAFIVLICLIAALLVAANMLFLVARRRREIGVLKALGARGSDIGLMILTEALALNFMGTAIGFGLIRIFATWTMVSNRIPLAEIGRATLADFGVVASAATAAATAFALIPAWQMARLTSMEVLRNE
jgi:hypothetical protein